MTSAFAPSFVYLRHGTRPIEVPGLGHFTVTTNGSTMFTHSILVEFWPWGAERPLRGHHSYRPTIELDGRIKLGARHPTRGEPWPQEALDHTELLARQVAQHDFGGFMFLLNDLCFYAAKGHRDAIAKAEDTIRRFEYTIAKRPDEPEHSMRHWRITLAKTRVELARLTAPEMQRCLTRIDNTRALAKRLYFTHGRHRMTESEITAALLFNLQGIE